MPKIVCSKRKENKCKETNECFWTGTNCINKKCSDLKEEYCKQVPDVCIWNSQIKKCIDLMLDKGTTSHQSKKELNSSEFNNAPLNVSFKKKPIKKISKLVDNNASNNKLVKNGRDINGNKNINKNINKNNIYENIDNRHCMYYSNFRHLTPIDTVDIDDCFKTKYDPDYKENYNIHLGQRKLLLSEIQLLTRYYQENKSDPVIVYVGAAPGTHLILLSELFPKVSFILFDGAKFDKKLHEYPKIFEIHEGDDGFVTTDSINKLKIILKKKDLLTNLLFVCDIRLGKEDKEEFEKGVLENMYAQQEWMEILKPKISFLKFRIPYNLKHGEKFNYTTGEILYGIWPTPLSGETRLLVRREDIGKKINYDFEKYEQVMFFHNKYERSYCFNYYNEIPSNIINLINSKNNPYCPCYDCLSELQILNKYSILMKRDLKIIINLIAYHMNYGKKPVFQTKGKEIEKRQLKKVKISCKENWFL